MTKVLHVVPSVPQARDRPLLGPSMLTGAAMRTSAVDLNAHWITQDPGATRWTPTGFVGGHERDERLLLRDFHHRFHGITRDIMQQQKRP